MAEIVNLRQARKRAARDAAATRAAINRAAHGISKVERAAAAGEESRLAKALDGARRERDVHGASDAVASPVDPERPIR